MSAAPSFQLLSPLSIKESKTNPRTHFDPTHLAELAESIKLNGVLSRSSFGRRGTTASSWSAATAGCAPPRSRNSG